jgi:hypothetical protein
MNGLYNLARVFTPTTGTGPITLGSAVAGYLTFDQADAPDGATVSYGIFDGPNSEAGWGVYDAGAGTLTRNVYRSTGAANTGLISLSGDAQVFITALAEDFASLVATPYLPLAGGHLSGELFLDFLPLAINEGGTGSRTAAGALTNLGAYPASNPSGYIAGNQTITLSGDIGGSGTTAITTTLPAVNTNVGTFAAVQVNAKGQVLSAGNLTGDVSTSGPTATLATVNSNVGTFQGITVDAKGRVTAASNQSYVTGGPYLPLTGGQLTGPLAINRTIPTGGNSGNLYLAGYMSSPGFIGFNAYLNAAFTAWLHLTGTGTAGVFGYDYSTNQFSWHTAPNASAGSTTATALLASLTNAGALNLFGSLNAIFVADRSTSGAGGFYRDAGISRLWDSVSGDVIQYNASHVGIFMAPNASYALAVTGSVYCSGILNANSGLYAAGYPVIGASSTYTVVTDPSGSNRIYLGNAGDPKNYYRNTSHYFQSDAGAADFAQISSGGLNVNSAIVAAGNIFANGGVFADNAGAGGSGNFGFSSGGGVHYIQMWPQWFWNFNTSSGDMTWVTPIAGNSLWTMRNDAWTYNIIGPVGGIGPFQNLSDERAKCDITTAKVGLAEVLRINPILFERRGAGPKAKRHNGTTAEIGFSAQQLAGVIPEAVTVSGFQLPDGGGTHDDPNPSLTVGVEPIVAALVNAVKELAGRINQVEARAH